MMVTRRGHKGRLLITGASGFTGRYVQAAALQAGYDCIALVAPQAPATSEGGSSGNGRESALVSVDEPRLQSGLETPDNHTGVIEEQGITTVPADLMSRDALAAALRHTKPDYVIHLAAVAFVGHADINAIYQTNIVGTLNLLDLLSEYCPGVKQVVVASSGNIYGAADVLPILETQPPRPLNDYAVSKYAMECAVRLRRGRLPIVVVRPFNYTGVGQSEDFLIAKMVAAYRRKLSHLTLGNTAVARDFSDVRDVADAYVRLLDKQASGGVFNICSGRSVPLLQIVAMLNQLAGYEMQIEVEDALIRKNEIVDLYGSDSALQSCIGPWRRYTLEDTLRWMLQSPLPGAQS